MDKYKIKATNIIAEEFEKKYITFGVSACGDEEVITTRYAIAAVPPFDVRFFTNPDNNGVDICIYELIAGIPKKKRARAVEACNILNEKCRFAKFYLNNSDKDISMEYDIYKGIPDERLGETVINAVGRMLSILSDNYEILVKAVYTDEDLEHYYGDEEA